MTGKSGELYTLRQAEERYPALTERYFRRLVAERRIPFYKVGGKVLVAEADIDALIERCRVEAWGALGGRRTRSRRAS